VARSTPDWWAAAPRGTAVLVGDLSEAERKRLSAVLLGACPAEAGVQAAAHAATTLLAYLVQSEWSRPEDAVDAALLQAVGAWDFRAGWFRKKVMVYDETAFVALAMALDVSQIRLDQPWLAEVLARCITGSALQTTALTHSALGEDLP